MSRIRLKQIQELSLLNLQDGQYLAYDATNGEFTNETPPGDGAKGIQGGNGAQGEKGDPGLKGQDGIVGEKGAIGADGQKGQAGILGATGDGGEEGEVGWEVAHVLGGWVGGRTRL